MRLIVGYETFKETNFTYDFLFIIYNVCSNCLYINQSVHRVLESFNIFYLSLNNNSRFCYTKIPIIGDFPLKYFVGMHLLTDTASGSRLFEEKLRGTKKLRGTGKTGVRKLGGKRKRAMKEVCEMQEGEGERRVGINCGEKQTGVNGKPLHV